MSYQPEHENQQSETVTSEEVRQSLLAQLDATRQAIEVLSEEELKAISGGTLRRAYSEADLALLARPQGRDHTPSLQRVHSSPALPLYHEDTSFLYHAAPSSPASSSSSSLSDEIVHAGWSPDNPLSRAKGQL
jgi:bacteriocin-like protein